MGDNKMGEKERVQKEEIIRKLESGSASYSHAAQLTLSLQRNDKAGLSPSVCTLSMCKWH